MPTRPIEGHGGDLHGVPAAASLKRAEEDPRPQEEEPREATGHTMDSGMVGPHWSCEGANTAGANDCVGGAENPSERTAANVLAVELAVPVGCALNCVLEQAWCSEATLEVLQLTGWQIVDCDLDRARSCCCCSGDKAGGGTLALPPPAPTPIAIKMGSKADC